MSTVVNPILYKKDYDKCVYNCKFYDLAKHCEKEGYNYSTIQYLKIVTNCYSKCLHYPKKNDNDIKKR